MRESTEKSNIVKLLMNYCPMEHVPEQLQWGHEKEIAASDLYRKKNSKKHHTQACGTVRINRRGFPEPVKQAKLRRGEVSAYRSSELLALKFKDKRNVTMLSTIYNEEMVQGRRNAAQQKPKCISDYNKYMGGGGGGVHRTDQLLQPYEIARKSLKWYKKLALHFLQLAMLNGFLLFKKDGG